MSKIDIGLVLSKTFTVIKKQPFIFIPFLVLAFLYAIFIVLTFPYTVEMMQAFESFDSEGYQYEYVMSPSDVFEDIASIFTGMAKLIVILTVGGFILWIIQIFLYTGTVSMIGDVIEGKKTSIGSFINVSISRGFIVLLSTIAAYIVVFLPSILGIFIFLISILSMSEEVIVTAFLIAFILFILQLLWLLAILFFLSSKIPRIIYIVITAITTAFVILGIFFIPLLIIAIPFFILLLILVMISMIIITFTIDYIIPSAVVLDNTGIIDALKKSFIFAKEHTINLGLLILIAIALIIIVSIPFGIFSVMMQMGDIMSSDFYSEEPQVYVPTTADLIIEIIQTFVLTGFISPFILLAFVLGYVNATKGREILEKIE